MYYNSLGGLFAKQCGTLRFGNKPEGSFCINYRAGMLMDWRGLWLGSQWMSFLSLFVKMLASSPGPPPSFSMVYAEKHISACNIEKMGMGLEMRLWKCGKQQIWNWCIVKGFQVTDRLSSDSLSSLGAGRGGGRRDNIHYAVPWSLYLLAKCHNYI